MASKLDNMKVRLASLSDERDRLDLAIEEMIADMAEVPADQRKTGDWSPKGEVETEIVDLGRAIVAADEPAASKH